jgi:preprotein translocase subunit SecA
MQRQMQARARQYQESHGDAEGRPEKPAAKAPVKAGPKVGRNDPCPCGSGKKFKKCHGASEDRPN